MIAPSSEQYRIVFEVERRLSVAERVQTQTAATLQRAACLRQAILHKALSSKPL